MTDLFSVAKRSDIMSQIRSNDTIPELLARKFLFSKGLRYRKNVKLLPGKPDIVLPKYKSVIFVNGCFWHGHKGCKAATLPTTRRTFWKNKINGNIIRDKSNIRKLKKSGWKVFIIWQCKLKNISIRTKTLNKLVEKLTMQ